MAGFSENVTALKMRDLVDQLVTKALAKQRPKYRYGTVVSINRATYKCVVNLNGDTTNVTVNMGSVQPSAVGQIVRVDGIGIDKFISDVMGKSFAFGPQPIDAGVNLNTLQLTNTYAQLVGGNATLALNYPETQAGLLEVFGGTSGTVFAWQRYTVYAPSAPNVYERTNYAGTWGAWRAVMSSTAWTTVDTQQVVLDTAVTVTTSPATVGPSIVLSGRAGDKIRIDTVWDVAVATGTFIGIVLMNGSAITSNEAHLSGGTAGTVRATVAQSWLVDLTTDGTRTLTTRASVTSGTATLNGTHTRMISTLLRQV